MEFENNSAIVEVAEPQIEQVAVTSEVAKVAEEVAKPQQSAEDNARFADARRKQELTEAKAKLAEYETKARMADRLASAAKQLGFDGSEEEIAIAIEAQARGITPEAVKEEYQSKTLAEENKSLKSKLIDIEVNEAITKDLQAIQKIYPEAKVIEGDDKQKFIILRANGFSEVEAYTALATAKAKTAVSPPPEIGTIKVAVPKKDYFTADEVKTMSQAEVSQNYDKIKKSMTKWR